MEAWKEDEKKILDAHMLSEQECYDKWHPVIGAVIGPEHVYCSQTTKNYANLCHNIERNGDSNDPNIVLDFGANIDIYRNSLIPMLCTGYVSTSPIGYNMNAKVGDIKKMFEIKTRKLTSKFSMELVEDKEDIIVKDYVVGVLASATIAEIDEYICGEIYAEAIKNEQMTFYEITKNDWIICDSVNFKLLETLYENVIEHPKIEDCIICGNKGDIDFYAYQLLNTVLQDDNEGNLVYGIRSRFDMQIKENNNIKIVKKIIK